MCLYKYLSVCVVECVSGRMQVHCAYCSLHATVLGLQDYSIFVNGYACNSICNCVCLHACPYVLVPVGRWGQRQNLQTLRCTCSLEKWNLRVTDLEEPARITVATRSKQQKHTVHRNTLALYRFCCIFHCGHDNITAQFSINFKELNLGSMSRYNILHDVIWQLCLI